jgi:hypothetical protein
MIRFSWIASVLVLAVLTGCATTGPSASLRQVADQVEAARAAAGKKDFSKIPPLAASVPTLNSVIAANSDGSLAAATHYYRAEIASLTNSQNFRAGLPADPALTQEAVTEYGKTLLYGQNMPEWKIYLPDVAYRRGTAANTGGLFDLALESFRLCAAAGHGGCMNALAVLLLRGTPSNQNVTESFHAFRAAAATGIIATCAGSFSAEDVALFIHFKVVSEPAGNEFDWVNQARNLASAAQQRTGFIDPCHGASIGLDEFQMRADEGDRQPAILEAVIRDSPDAPDRIIAEYMLGRLDEAALQTRLSGEELSPSNTCDVEFSLLWNDSRLGQKTAAQKHYSALLKSPPLGCPKQVLFARKLGFTPESGS